VKAYLVEIGIPAGRNRTAGRGERELLVPTTDNTEEPRNRRVEINVR
jgi:outer membrane protein OmpA-like peptidoglycan-associated protein